MTTRNDGNLRLMLCWAAVALLLGGQASSADPQTVAGVWKQIDPDTGNVGALVTFTESGAFSKVRSRNCISTLATTPIRSAANAREASVANRYSASFSLME